MKEEEVNRCQIQEWYPRFKSDSIKTMIHELPESFIKESIKTLGGSVFPKLNWSAPKDAAWISSTGNLCCNSFSEVALLLRASDSLIHDLPPKFFLALHRWYSSLLPEMEFRCFVRNGILVGISQQEVTGFYPVLVEKKDELMTTIQGFFIHKVKGNFESGSYTFDVCVTNDERVKLLDFNPWGAFTLPLFITWEELEDKLKEEENRLEFRIVESQCGVRPGLKTAVPYDYLDSSPGSGWDEFLRKADEQSAQQVRSTRAGA
ncbi:unnamed protein product [Withania somnifera]